MIKLVLELFQAIWPFLKESWFQGEAVHVWVKRNRMSVLWLTIMFIMVVAVFTLVSELRDYRVAFEVQTKELTESRTQLHVLQDRNKELENQKLAFQTLQTEHAALVEKHEVLMEWLSNCDISPVQQAGLACPAPKVITRTVTRPVYRSVYRHTVNPKEVKPRPETFREKMKRIFGNKS